MILDINQSSLYFGNVYIIFKIPFYKTLKRASKTGIIFKFLTTVKYYNIASELKIKIENIKTELKIFPM